MARDALGDRAGSVVVLEPKTGAVRAMWSFPGYDPNLIANPDFEQARGVLAFYENFPGDPLLANTYQQRYMPGSTFKLLTTGIALQNGVVNLESEFPDESEFLPPQTTNPIENFEGTTCGGDLTEVFARSCNIAFARIALDMGVQRILDGVAAWGVGQPIPDRSPRGRRPARSAPRPTSTSSCPCWRSASRRPRASTPRWLCSRVGMPNVNGYEACRMIFAQE